MCKEEEEEEEEEEQEEEREEEEEEEEKEERKFLDQSFKSLALLCIRWSQAGWDCSSEHTNALYTIACMDLPLGIPPDTTVMAAGCMDAKYRLVQNAHGSHPFGIANLYLCLPIGSSLIASSTSCQCIPSKPVLQGCFNAA